MRRNNMETLQHYGVKGMKWGVRRYQPYPKGKTGTFKGVTVNKSNNKNTSSRMSTSAKLPNGDTIKIEQNKDPILAKVLGRVSSNIREEQKKSKMFTITDSNGSKVGNGQIYRESKDELNLVWLGVNRKNRGKGIGTAAVTAAYLYAQKEGIPKLTLEVPGSSPDALHIYKKLGFVEKEKLSEDDLWGGLTAMELRVPNKQDTIKHYGVKGMKWGIRRYQPYPKGKKGTFIGSKGRELKSLVDSRTRSLNKKSTSDIRKNANRLRMENEYKRLSRIRSKTGTIKDWKQYRRRSEMSDSELKRKVNRLKAIEEYKIEAQKANRGTIDKGKKILSDYGKVLVPLATGYVAGKVSSETIKELLKNVNLSDREINDIFNMILK